MSKSVTILDKDTFDGAIAKGLVVVDFYADWCSPCRMLAPVLEETAEKLGDKVTICKINVDEARDLGQKYEIRNIPNVCIFRDGELVDRILGFKPVEEFIELISKNI